VQWVGDTRKSVEEIAKEVIAGKWGNGSAREKALKAAGYDFHTVQNYVNKLLTPKKKSVNQIAKEVIQGKWGNGYARKKALEKAGYNYNEVQSAVNRMM
jgi:Holliday junction resolvasome RuvABC DNA-binding subunit